MAERAGFSDTSPEAMRVQYRRYREMTPAEKLRRVGELTETAHRFALAGLAQRFPGAARRELLLRLAVQRLGPEVVAQAYRWRRDVLGILRAQGGRLDRERLNALQARR